MSSEKNQMGENDVEAQDQVPAEDFKLGTESTMLNFGTVNNTNKERSQSRAFDIEEKEMYVPDKMENEIASVSRGGSQAVETFNGDNIMDDIVNWANLHKEGRSQKEKRNRRKDLYKAAISGDWKKAEQLFKKYPDQITPSTSLNDFGETALHIATAADHTQFVHYLVHFMNVDDLTVQTNGRDTAFYYAAARGNIEVVKLMILKNDQLAFLEGGASMLPIQAAALNGHGEIVRMLYSLTKDHLDNTRAVDLLMALIDCDMYDIAIRVLNEKLWLAIETNMDEELAIYSFARKPQILTSNSNASRGFLTNYFSERRQKQLRNRGIELLKLLLELATSVVNEKIPKLINTSLFIAAKCGNYEYISTVIHLYPDLAFELDSNNYTIFHYAVFYRHVNIYNIVHEAKSIKNMIKLMTDEQGNNFLHFAAKLPFTGLQVVPGAALQLQREWLWFEEVKKVVGAEHIMATNTDQKTPEELFEEQHEKLRKEGERWLTKTSDSCMLVATLIATVSFTGVFSVPGGNGQDTGVPVLLDNIWFQIFAISDAITLIFSASSILFFLSILTSRYSMREFYKSLPFKLLFGLFSLFISILAMMVASIAAFFVIFRHKKLQFAYPVAAVALVPILLVARLHLPLFFQIFRSTSMFFLQFRHHRFFVRDLKKKFD
ncbi:Ankyrin repeat family protein [Euphorbia peplus]|nr:Ankyrin repeat family protein [Euphorbia peplus]